jgi:hypothetical protein
VEDTPEGVALATRADKTKDQIRIAEVRRTYLRLVPIIDSSRSRWRIELDPAAVSGGFRAPKV